MRRGQPLGLDELMIVNPGPSGTGAFFLGEDGTLYQVQGFGLSGSTEFAEVPNEGLGEDEGRELGGFFVGEDGTLYEVVR